MIQKADTQMIKRFNETQLLKLIRDLGPISRIELANRTKMSKVAVFDIINRLIEQQYVEDVGKGKSTKRGGKRPSLVKLDTSSHFVIGIELRRREALLTLANVEATIIQIKKFNFNVETDPNIVIGKMFSRIDTMLQNANVRRDQLVSIGIGIPGVIDYHLGKLRFADTLKGWDTVELRKVFNSEFGVPIILENDVNTIALGESILGAGRGVLDIVCLWIGSGIGAGIVVNGQLIRGFGGGAGEIGYLEINRHCSTEMSFRHIYKDQKFFGDVLSEQNLHSVLLTHLGNVPHKTFETKPIISLLKSKTNQPLINEILDEYAYFLGILCLDIFKIINPEILILSGTIPENSPYVVEKVNNFVSENTRQIPLFSGSIVVGKLKEKAGLQGAITLALQVIFESD